MGQRWRGLRGMTVRQKTVHLRVLTSRLSLVTHEKSIRRARRITR